MGGLDQLDDAELADDIPAIIRIMKEKDEIREVGALRCAIAAALR